LSGETVKKQINMSSPRFSLNMQELKPHGELIADAIRASILGGHFRPGDKLDQQEIADELSVSKIPVREALRTLDAEGMITMRRNKGAVVTERTVAELSELYYIRGVLEGVAAERAAGQIDDKRIEKMQSIIEVAEHTSELNQLLALNNDFHMILYRAFPQSLTADLIQQLRNKVAPYNRMYLDLAGSNKAAAWDDHRRIYEACRSRDPELAKIETQRHLERVLETIVLVMENA
jgi:DNA-binding GntR family transcriptional regulator